MQTELYAYNSHFVGVPTRVSIFPYYARNCE